MSAERPSRVGVCFQERSWRRSVSHKLSLYKNMLPLDLREYELGALALNMVSTRPGRTRSPVAADAIGDSGYLCSYQFGSDKMAMGTYSGFANDSASVTACVMISKISLGRAVIL